MYSENCFDIIVQLKSWLVRNPPRTGPWPVCLGLVLNIMTL